MFDVLLITGAAGAGKTSTAQAWATSRREITAHLSHDEVMLFVKSGAVSPAKHVTAEAERQWRIALDICVATACIYAISGVRCAIDTFLLPKLLEFWSGLAHLRVGLVVLHPSLDIAVARNEARMEQTGWGVPTWQVNANHAAMAAWQGRPEACVVDTSYMTQAQVIVAIDTFENRSSFASIY